MEQWGMAIAAKRVHHSTNFKLESPITRHEVPTAYSHGCQPMEPERKNSSRVAATAKLQDRLSAMPPEKTPKTTFLNFCTRLEEL